MQFVTAHALGLQCFIAMEMVTWLLDNFDDIELRKQAVRFAQVSCSVQWRKIKMFIALIGDVGQSSDCTRVW